MKQLNTKAIREKEYQYLLDNLEYDYFELDYIPTQKELITLIRDEVIKQRLTPYYKNHYHSISIPYLALRENIQSYIQGLPSYITTAYSNYDIQELYKSWGIELIEDVDYINIVNHYWKQLAINLIKITGLNGSERA